jgi:hypothetical protein
MLTVGNGAAIALAFMAAMAVLAGCSAGDAPPGTPGSLTTHLNGRFESGAGLRP